MSRRFSTFRKFLLGLIIAISCISIGLCIPLLPVLRDRKIFWMIVSIQSACLVRSLWSALRKPLLKHHQSVANETIGLILLLPFELVLALVTATSPLERERTSRLTPTILQVFVLVNAVINLSYTACLLLTTLITSAAFDTDIWVRDIDSSPSPFPILLFVFPCLSRWYSSPTSQESVDVTHEATTLHCLPGCQCTNKPHPLSPRCPSLGTPTESGFSRNDSDQPSNPTSLSRSLVRIPNAIERRVSIAIAFEV
ncbi:hypothetical protein FPV67DRAFT_1018660 [Lyophyllum atratum]|nr:hypothetical protein FPV67DRAFT_1018660 [Lyophyllum atratum]